MSVHRAPLPLTAAVLALVALVALPAGANAAKTKVEAAQQYVSLSIKGTKGWRIDIGGLTGGRYKKNPSISVDAQGPSGETVAYSVHGRLTGDGTIDAKLPGVGRIALAFERTSTTPIEFSGAGCHASGQAHEYKGYFRGTIKLRGGGGFTTVDRSSARGQIIETPKVTCPVKQEETASTEGSAEEALAGITTLYAGRKLFGGELTFEVTRSESADGTQGSPEFSVGFYKVRHGLTTSITVRAAGKPSDFTVSGQSGEPSEATLDAPAPFTGAAAFKLESPTVASWTGDLRVRMPVLGEISLSTPKLWSTLCEGANCTKTVPKSVHLQIITVSFEEDG